MLVVDRYEIGERQTSACAAPTDWLENLGLGDVDPPDASTSSSSTRPLRSFRWPLPWTFSHVRLPRAVRAAVGAGGEARFETAKVDGRTREGTRHVVHTDRGDLRAPLVVDALGWRRVLSRRARDPAAGRAALARARGPPGRQRRRTSRCGSTARTSAPATRGASRPATSCASASARSTRATTSRSRPCGWPSDLGLPADGYQGNWIPHQLRAATEDGVFFAGDTAGHCLPLTAEGIRTALYFGLACGASCAPSCEGRQDARAGADALPRRCTRTAASPGAGCCGCSRRSVALNRYPAMTSVTELMSHHAVLDRGFTRYLDICPPPAVVRADSAPQAPAMATSTAQP